MNYHIPVLVSESLKFLTVSPGFIYIDATCGNGGHSLEILKQGGIVYAIDQDKENLKIAQNRIKKEGMAKNFYPIHDNFSNLADIIKAHIKNPAKIKGLLFDLGLSRNQQKSKNRGFSYNDDLSLDMRLDPKNQDLTAEHIINTYSYQQLFQIFSFYAQEKYSKPLAIYLIKTRQKKPFRSGQALGDAIRDFYQKRSIKTKFDPSTKVFLALKIVVNQEYENLKSALSQTLSCLPPQTVVVIISFHSGEDRIVKRFIKTHPNQLKVITKKAVRPSFSDVKDNPLSRSAILRAYLNKNDSR